MTKAVIVTLADEVTADLNKKSGGWPAKFIAERKYQPKTDYEDAGTLRVQVVPLTWQKSPDNRSEWSHEYTIGIGLHYRAKPEAGDQAATRFDDLLKLVEEISDHYEDTRPTVADCVLTGVSFGGGTGQPYHHESIESKNAFISVIYLTFQKYR